MRSRGEPVAWSWRLAVTHVGQVQWELVEPLDDDSIYAQFLGERGPGLHHVGVAVASYEDALAEAAERGQDVLLGGEYQGIEFAYLATDDDLGVITEIFSGAPGEDQQPDATYP
jgi:4-hydroxyphenylpyruvate dioxygenase-like putative hemolysin